MRRFTRLFGFAAVALAVSPVAIATVPSTADAQEFVSKTYHDWIFFDWCGGSTCRLPGPDTCCFVQAS